MLTVRIPSRRIEKCDPVLIRFAKQINGSIIRNSLNRQCTESVLVRYNSCFTKSYCFHIGTPFYRSLMPSVPFRLFRLVQQIPHAGVVNVYRSLSDPNPEPSYLPSAPVSPHQLHVNLASPPLWQLSLPHLHTTKSIVLQYGQPG